MEPSYWGQEVNYENCHDSCMKVGWCNQITTICMTHMYDSTRIQGSFILSRLIIQKLKAFFKTRFRVKNKKLKFFTKLKKISLCHDHGSLTFKTVLAVPCLEPETDIHTSAYPYISSPN